MSADLLKSPAPSPRLYALTSQAVIRADAMGLLRDNSDAPERQASLGLVTLLDVSLEESPLPRTEWVGLEPALGTELLAALVGVSSSTLRRYAADTRPTPDGVAARLHHVALIVGDLSGSYNEIGVRRWFSRPRTQLSGQTPAAVLTGEWDPRDEGPTRVRQLAAALLGAAAT